MAFMPSFRAWLKKARLPQRPFRRRSRPLVELLEARNLLSGPGSSLPPLTPPQSPPSQVGQPPAANPPTDPGQTGQSSPGTPTSSSGQTGSSPSPVSFGPDYSAFLTELYEDVLHRTGGADEIASWQNAMAAGVSRQQVALSFSHSVEYQSNLIRDDYRTILGRDPSDAEVAAWLRPLQAGMTEKQLAAAFLTSGEFYVAQGDTNQGWISGLYTMVLQRAPDGPGLGTWTYLMDTGLSRSNVVLAFLNGPEANGLMVANAYETYLQRDPAPAEEALWIHGIPPSLSPNQLMSAIVSSPEYPVQPDIAAAPYGGAVTISGVSPDTGVSSTDGITRATQLSVFGTGTPDTRLLIVVDGAANTWADTQSNGTWTANLAGPLSEGTHQITVRVPGGTASASSMPQYTVTVELTPPKVALQSSSPTGFVSDLTATASDSFAINPQVTINVDLKHDGTFTDPGDQGYATAALVGSTATVPLGYLSPGTYSVQAQVSDLAGNTGTSATVTVQVEGGQYPRRLKILPPNPEPVPAPNPNLGFVGSQSLTDLFNGYSQVAGLGLSMIPGGGAFAPAGGTTAPSGTGPTSPAGAGLTLPSSGGGASAGTGTTMTVAQFINIQSQYYVFDSQNDVLVRVRLQSRDHMEQAAADLQNNLGMTITQVFPQQYSIEGYLPIAKLIQIATVTDFGAVTPAYAAMLNSGPVTSQGDATILANQFRDQTGNTGSGVTIGAISDSVNKVGGGIAASQQIGALPAAGVNVLQDGTAPTNTDEGRGILEVAHDVAPGASLAFTSADQGPQAMAQGIVNLATQAGAKVIVDDVSFPDEPFFNDGLVAQAVNQVVNDNNVLYVTSAGNFANNAWADRFRSVNGTVGGISGTFQNFDASGQKLLQQFTLQPGQTIDLAFQWDAPFLEGGSPLPQFQVPNNLAALVTDASGSRVLKSFADDNQNTGEALQRVIFTNDGSYGTNTFALAFQLVSGPAPTQLKWIRFDHNAPAQYQGAPAIWGHAAATGALTVGAVPFNNIQNPEPYTSQGKATILFDVAGNRLSKPEVRNKPDLAGPDGVSTADFPFIPGLPPGTFPVFTGTSAAAAHVAGAAALLHQAISATPAAIDQGLIASALDVGPTAWDPLTGAGLIQLAPSLTVTSKSVGQLRVGPNVDISHSFKTNVSSSGSALSGASSGASGSSTSSNILLNAFPNVDTTAHANNEWEEDIAINPTNPQQMFLEANEDTAEPGIFVTFSTDGGATWTGRIIADGNDSFDTACCDPSVSWDNFGNLFVSYINDAATKDILLLSTDGGATFKEIDTFPAADQPKVATGAGAVWIVDNNSDVEAAGAKVTGLGAVGAFTNMISVPNSSGGNFGTITVGPAGQVLVSYQDSGSGVGPDTIMTALIPTGLANPVFNNPIAATPTNVGAFRPITPQPQRTIDADGRVAYDNSAGPHSGRVYLDYVDAADTSTSNTNIFVRFSDDNGTTWSPPVQVNDDTGTASHFWPRLKVDPTTGFVAVSWYDTRLDTGPGSPGDTDGVANDSTEFFATASQDGGNTFLPNVQVSQGPSSAIANPNNDNDYGDYSGLAFFGGNFYPAWADNSNSTGTNPDGTLSGFDVMTAKVNVAALASINSFENETNQTSEKAFNEGVLTTTAAINGEGIAPLVGINWPDYDWYRWTAGQAGIFTATVKISAHVGDLELHIFTVNSQDTLINLGNAVVPGATTLTVSTSLSAGEPILVEVKGREIAPGLFGKGLYDLDVSLQ
jgi:hypothetical protein